MRRMRPAGGIENFRRPDKKDNKQLTGGPWCGSPLRTDRTRGWGLGLRIGRWIHTPVCTPMQNGAKWCGMYHRAGIPVTPDPKRLSQIDYMIVAGVETGRHVDRV